jgi:hypothetical protein
MRQIAVVLALILAACGSDSTGPSTGTLFVSFDAGSCAAGNAEVFVDGTSQGSYFWTPGQQRSWTTGAGSHAVGAREVGGTGLTWPAQTVTVPKDGSYSAVFTC